VRLTLYAAGVEVLERRGSSLFLAPAMLTVLRFVEEYLGSEIKVVGRGSVSLGRRVSSPDLWE
jgi:hypothetical protein